MPEEQCVVSWSVRRVVCCSVRRVMCCSVRCLEYPTAILPRSSPSKTTKGPRMDSARFVGERRTFQARDASGLPSMTFGAQ